MKKIDITGWKEFCLNDLFYVEKGTRFNKINRRSGELPLITAGEQNQGVAEFIEYNSILKLYDGQHLTIDMFCNCFFRDYQYVSDDNILTLISRGYDFSKNHLLFICKVINITKSKYNYKSQYRQKTFTHHTVFLPASSNGEPDWDYMEKYMQRIEDETNKKMDLLMNL